MSSWMAVLAEFGGMSVEDGDLVRLGVSLFLGVFLVSLAWSLTSEHRSQPPL